MNDYCNGIVYATGYVANDADKKYLVIRNLDSWYPEQISNESGYKVYKSIHNYGRDGKPQYVVKARNINSVPNLESIVSHSDFCRAYIEIHGVIDMGTTIDRKGNKFTKPRLRIYGSEDVISFINDVLPAKRKKLQYISNQVENRYIGKTCAIYYQSKNEIEDILNWINGSQRNEHVWSKWNKIISI